MRTYTEAAYKRDELRRRRVHDDFHPFISCVVNSQQRRHRDSNADINTFRLRTAALNGKE
jgi:hypothetical protein